jgi:hypothetical protein
MGTETKMREAKRIALYDADVTLYPGYTTDTKTSMALNSLLNNLLGYKIGDVDVYKVNVEVSGVFAKVLEPRWIEIKLQGKVEDESFEAKITYCGSFSIYWAEESEKPKRAGPPKAFG